MSLRSESSSGHLGSENKKRQNQQPFTAVKAEVLISLFIRIPRGALRKPVGLGKWHRRKALAVQT